MIAHGGLSYHFSEEWGLALEAAMAMNNDRSERICIESFYNDFGDNGGLDAKCAAPGVGDGGNNARMPTVNIGPAYMPIIEIGQILSLSVVWTPIYGKQIFSFLPRTSHMDIFLIAGGGAALSTFQRPREDKKGIPVLKNRNKARLKKKKAEETEAAMQTTGTAFEDKHYWGVAGRPPCRKYHQSLHCAGCGAKVLLSQAAVLEGGIA